MGTYTKDKILALDLAAQDYQVAKEAVREAKLSADAKKRDLITEMGAIISYTDKDRVSQLALVGLMTVYGIPVPQGMKEDVKESIK